MEIGYFAMPSHPPECGLKEGHEWDLQVLRWLDELGYQEAWIGEHHTAPWEPHPAPDLILAQAFRADQEYPHRARRLPAALSSPGRARQPRRDARPSLRRPANFGVAASGLPSDWAMFNVDGMSGQNRDMTREALEIILKMWSDPAPFTYQGKYWTVNKPDTMFDFLKPHLKPVQAPHPPIGVAGLSKNSDTLKLAGERGFIPMSLNLNPAYVGSHWDSVEAGAAKTGRKPNRSDWRLVREVFVADTDEEAWKLSTGDMMGRMMGEYFLPLLGHFGFKDYLKHSPEVPGLRRHRRLLREAQLDRRLARDRHREDRDRSGTRSAASACCWCSASTTSTSRKPGTTRCAAEARGAAAAEASRHGVGQGGVICPLPSPRSSRGEGRGEGLSPRDGERLELAESSPHPALRADLSPQAGRGDPFAMPQCFPIQFSNSHHLPSSFRGAKHGAIHNHDWEIWI